MKQNQNSVPQLHQLHSRAQQSDHAGQCASQSRSITPGGSIGWPCPIGHPPQVLQFCGFVEHWFGFFGGVAAGGLCWKVFWVEVWTGRGGGPGPSQAWIEEEWVEHPMFAPWCRVQGSLPTQLTTFPWLSPWVFQAPALHASQSQHRLPSTDSGVSGHVSASSLLAETHLAPGRADTTGKCFPGKCFYLRRSECVLGCSSKWRMLPADSETTSFRVLDCSQITQLLWTWLVKFHSGLFGSKCPRKICPVHRALADFSSYLPSFLLLTLINHILYDRDVRKFVALLF